VYHYITAKLLHAASSSHMHEIVANANDVFVDPGPPLQLERQIFQSTVYRACICSPRKFFSDYSTAWWWHALPERSASILVVENVEGWVDITITVSTLCRYDIDQISRHRYDIYDIYRIYRCI